MLVIFPCLIAASLLVVLMQKRMKTGLWLKRLSIFCIAASISVAKFNAGLSLPLIAFVFMITVGVLSLFFTLGDEASASPH